MLARLAARVATAARAGSMPIEAPFTGEVLAEVPAGTPADVAAAVAAAREAQVAWAQRSLDERAAVLLRFHDLFIAHAAEILDVIQLETGKSRHHAFEEVEDIAIQARYYAHSAEDHLPPRRRQGALPLLTRTTEHHRPRGVIGIIAPWNYPLMMAGWKVGPALAMGNTVVLKPSARTPLTALLLAEIASGILPPGVLNVITGTGDEVGTEMVRHPGIGMISVTGDTDTGKKIARLASETVKRLHLELGGKAPVIVFDDADLDYVAEQIRYFGYWNNGQDCTAATRILAGPKVYEKLVATLADQVRQITFGDPAEGEYDLGSLIARGQVEKVAGMVDRARVGAEVVVGGHAPERPGHYYEPTVIAGPDQRSEIIQDEVFGPVVTVQRFTDEALAIRWANDVRFGLAASVFTNDLGRAFRVAKAIQFGTVWINEHFTLVSEMPHGGFKESGWGKDQSAYALEDYSVIKHVMAKIS